MRALTQVADWISAPYTVYLVLRDREVSRWPKIGAIVLFVALFAYMVSPIDVIPDVVPLSGWLDDILAFSLVMFVSGKILPQVQLKEKNKTAEKRAHRILFIIIASVVLAITLMLSLLATLIIVIVKLSGG
jgi:uncharacterized membrane protein YkvA (DUF1232 family)